MAEKRKRGQNFTREEKEKLLCLVWRHKDILLCKKTDNPSSIAKAKAWISVMEKFNRSATTIRNKESLIKLWEKLKSDGRLYFTKYYQNGTRGKPSYLDKDPIMEQVCSMIGNGCTEVLNLKDYDSDTTMAEYTDPLSEPTEEKVLVNEEAELQMSSELEDAVEVEPASEPSKHGQSMRHKKPLWSRRRRQLNKSCERSEAVPTVCSCTKKKYEEDLKINLLERELEFKSKLFELQLRAATKEVEIKSEILRQVKAGKISSQLLGVRHPSQEAEEIK